MFPLGKQGDRIVPTSGLHSESLHLYNQSCFKNSMKQNVFVIFVLFCLSQAFCF